jgi:hypothetical protein
MHVCFASRHYPRISISRCVHLVLDKLKGHQEDIENYVRNNLKVSELALRDQFAEDIRVRARDVFLWVVLVVRLLNQESDQGNSHNLQAHLDAIPSGLHDLFEDAIIERGADGSRYLLPILLWVLFATRPLSPWELYHAVLYARGDLDGAVIPDHVPDPSQVERFILSTSKGLAEISEIRGPLEQQSQPRVQLIHETVREYLQSSGISRLENSFCNNPKGLSHEFLKSRCADYMSFAASFIQQFEVSTTSDFDTRKCRYDYISDRFFFLDYAIWYLVNHAELAQAHGVSQVSFLETFPLDLVIKLSNLATYTDTIPRIYYPSTTKTYIFAFLEAPGLLQLDLDRLKGGGEHRSRVDAGVMSTTDIGDVLNSLQGDQGTPLHVAIYTRSFRTIKLLLEHGSDVNVTGGIIGTPLETAVMYGCDLNIVELLFQYGADVTVRSGGETALYFAAGHATLDIVRLFLKHCADINAQDGRKGSALQRACSRGSLRVVKCLVEHGANVNAKGVKDGYGTALQAARNRRRQKIVDYLLRHGARDDDGET